MDEKEISFHKMIEQYNKASLGKNKLRGKKSVTEREAQGAIAEIYVEKNSLKNKMLVPDYAARRKGEKLKLVKNKIWQSADPWDVGQRIESEIDEMVSKEIVIKSLDYGRNLTENEKKELKTEYQRPSRYAYVVKKGSKVDIPEGYCKVATLEDGKNRSGYLPFGWVCVKNSQIMIFDEGKI